MAKLPWAVLAIYYREQSCNQTTILYKNNKVGRFWLCTFPATRLSKTAHNIFWRYQFLRYLTIWKGGTTYNCSSAVMPYCCHHCYSPMVVDNGRYLHKVSLPWHFEWRVVNSECYLVDVVERWLNCGWMVVKWFAECRLISVTSFKVLMYAVLMWHFLYCIYCQLCLLLNEF